MDQDCTLKGDDFTARRDMLRQQILPKIRGFSQDASHVQLRFDDTDAMRAELGDLIDFERKCCGFLEWTLSDPAVLTITAPEGGEDALHALKARIMGN